ncbi:MAG: CBS domain-containing protein [Chitinophagales bacterium]|nr:CBS domain-containing protein [Chitinophagales bacterium]
MHIGAICSRETIIASPADSIQTASQQMLQYNVGSLVLVETDAKGNKPVGIVTDRDIVLKVIAPELKISEVKLADIMSTKLLTAKETDDVYETLKKMRAKVVRRIPVVDEEGYLKGMLTIDDLLEFFNKEMGEVVSLFKKEQGR